MESLPFEPSAFVTEAGDTVWGELGFLDVPVRHGAPGTGSIRLAVARFATTSASPGTPIVYLEGGPGAAGIHAERLPLLNRLRDFGDVIAFDQRGTGASSPDLTCGSTLSPSPETIRTRSALVELEVRAARECASELAARGIDLTAFNVFESADDVDDIREALGVDQVRLVGISFGSHLALTTMLRHDTRVERAVLAAVEGLDHTAKLPSALDHHLGVVSDLLANDSIAGTRLPDFEALVEAVLAELDEGPRTVQLASGESMVLTGFLFRRLVAGSIVRRQFFESVLEEFGPIADNDFRPLAEIAQSMGTARPFGMRAAMDCASGSSPDRIRRVQLERESSLLRGVVDFPFPEVCSAWGIEPLGGSLWEPFQSARPVQFLTGTLDGLTPIANVQEIRAGVANSGHIVIERMGHEGPGMWFASPDVLSLVGSFLMGEAPTDTVVTAPPFVWSR